MARRGRIGLALLAMILALAPFSVRAANHTITVADFFFSPTKTHVQLNDSVIWVWGGAFLHSSTSDIGSGKTWGSGIMTTGRFGIKITATDGAGPFPYHCSVHALTMKDTIFLDPPPACCLTNTGNIDCDPLQKVDISDLSTLVDHLFITLTPLCCEKAANTDGSGVVDISDLSRLVDFLFINFTPLAPCQ